MVRVRRGDTLGGGGMASSRPRAIYDRIASPLQITLSYLQHPQPVPSLAAFSTSRLTSWVLGCVELCATSMLPRPREGAATAAAHRQLTTRTLAPKFYPAQIYRIILQYYTLA
jgi:hypothetical protein